MKVEFANGAPAPITQANRITCPLLGIFGNEDASLSREDVDDYEAALRDAGVSYAFHRLDDAGHGFQDFTNDERYRAPQSEEAWTLALAFLEQNLGAHPRFNLSKTGRCSTNPSTVPQHFSRKASHENVHATARNDRLR